MVTMRRDVAVNKNVSMDNGLTPYDRFIMKKNARRNIESVATDAKTNKEPVRFRSDTNNFNLDAMATKNKVVVAKETEYDLYLLSELNNPMRTLPLMSEKEFYEKKEERVSAVKAGKSASQVKKDTRPGQLSRIGKIILSAYVLVALLTAFTLIAVNVFKEPVLADASENVTTGERVIRPMTVETLDQQDSNWFDKLCDAVKK